MPMRNSYGLAAPMALSDEGLILDSSNLKGSDNPPRRPVTEPDRETMRANRDSRL